jgi:hypothetical protein
MLSVANKPIMLSVIMPNVIMLSVVMLNVVMPNVVMLSVVILSLVMLSVILLSDIVLGVVTPNVVTLNVVAPTKSLVRLAPVVKHPIFFNPLSDEPPLHHLQVEWILGNQGTCRKKVITRKNG